MVDALAAIDAHIALQESRVAGVLADIDAAEAQVVQARQDAAVLEAEIELEMSGSNSERSRPLLRPALTVSISSTPSI